MDNDDLDALAAEYVLGTLAADERNHAEALINVDPGFGETVRQWERRLGELNVMVEAVEPPAEVWDKIKSGVGALPPAGGVSLAPTDAPTGTAANAGPETGLATKSEPGAAAKGPESVGAAGVIGSSPEASAATAAQAKPEFAPPPAEFPSAPVRLAPAKTERTFDAPLLARRLGRWRVVAALACLLAVLLAAFIVLSQVDPALIPPGGFHIPQLVAQQTAPAQPVAAAPAGRLVAVLQQEPSSPAFLLTIDPASRTLTVRTISAQAQAGHSYELWMIAPHSAPRALGLVGGQEFTQTPLPAGLDLGTMQAATYIVSFEPAGGSKTAAPSGPILFTGKLVESTPSATPPPKT